MLVAANHAGRDAAVWNQFRRIEFTEANAVAQHAIKRVVQSRLRQQPLARRRRNVFHVFVIRKVTARLERLRDRFLITHLPFHMPLDHGVDTAEVGNHKTLKPPLPLEYLGQH